MAMGIFGLLHLIANGYATDVAFFSGFPVFVLLGCLHQDRRKLQTQDTRYRPFYEATPLIPFTGSQTLRGLREMGWKAPLIGVVLTGVVRYFHAAWFG